MYRGEEGGCGASKRQRSNQQHCAQDNASMPRDGCNQHESAPVPVAPPIAAPRTEASSLHTGSTRAPPVQWLQDNKSYVMTLHVTVCLHVPAPSDLVIR
eukprot:m.720150 g.720150  ORF g.720150 m.720150 type:complete len:99 (+) comp23003_c0_seq14:2516-2812(+)